MTKHLITNPSKLSQPAGAALALMGIKGMIPLWHGVQGCTAFAKVLFISHFREPMPFQNTAISQTNVIMGSNDNVVEALANIGHQAEIIGIITTGVAETSGVDLKAICLEVEKRSPDAKVLYLNTPDYEGNLASGYRLAIEHLLASFVKKTARKNTRQVALFPGPYVTPGEVEEVRSILHDFDLHPLFCPDLGDSLLGYLEVQPFSSCTSGGISFDEIEKLSASTLAISIGSTMESSARQFGETHDIPVLHYDSLSLLEEIDHLFGSLQNISGLKPGRKYRRQRQHYLDTLLDTDVHFHGQKAAVAGDVEFVKRWKAVLTMLEMDTFCLTDQEAPDLHAGDYAALNDRMERCKPDLVIGNTHVARLAGELDIPVIRAGIPVTDRMGEPQSVRIGYRGAASQLMECANAILEHNHCHQPYISMLTGTLV